MQYPYSQHMYFLVNAVVHVRVRVLVLSSSKLFMQLYLLNAAAGKCSSTCPRTCTCTFSSKFKLHVITCTGKYNFKMQQYIELFSKCSTFKYYMYYKVPVHVLSSSKFKLYETIILKCSSTCTVHLNLASTCKCSITCTYQCA